MSDRTASEELDGNPGVPDEPPNDNYEWTAEPDDPDAAGMPGEFVNGPGDGVPGVRSEDNAAPEFDPESNN